MKRKEKEKNNNNYGWHAENIIKTQISYGGKQQDDYQIPQETLPLKSTCCLGAKRTERRC